MLSGPLIILWSFARSCRAAPVMFFMKEARIRLTRKATLRSTIGGATTSTQIPAGNGRGLVLEARGSLHEAVNPSAHRTLITYDKFELLPERVTNAAGLVVEAQYDYRTQKPREVIDANGNHSRFNYSPLGLLQSSFVVGKTPAEGDQSRPSLRMEYGFLAFTESAPANRLPIFVRTIRHIHHDTEMDVSLPERDQTLTTLEYSDGFGRLLQTRVQAERVRFGDSEFGGGESVLPVSQSDGAGGDIAGVNNPDEARPNVVVSGWQTYDNKGRTVETYEPFFSQGWEYGQPSEIQTGQKVVMFYDPQGHDVRTLNPDGSEERSHLAFPGPLLYPIWHILKFSSPHPGKLIPMTKTTMPDVLTAASTAFTRITGIRRAVSQSMLWAELSKRWSAIAMRPLTLAIPCHQSLNFELAPPTTSRQPTNCQGCYYLRTRTSRANRIPLCLRSSKPQAED